MNLVFEKLAQVLAASQVWTIGIAAGFFRVAGATYPVTVRLYRGGQVIGTMDNFEAGDYVQGIEFDRVEIVNGAIAQAVTVQISGGGSGSDRVVGEVSVIDGGPAITLGDTAFSQYARITATVGQYGVAQIWNPAGSGRVIVLRRIGVQLSVAGLINIKAGSVALSNLVGGLVNKNVIDGAPSAVAAGEYRYELFGTDPATSMPGGLQTIGYNNSNANEDYLYDFDPPLRIGEGRGVALLARTANAALTANMQGELE